MHCNEHMRACTCTTYNGSRIIPNRTTARTAAHVSTRIFRTLLRRLANKQRSHNPFPIPPLRVVVRDLNPINTHVLAHTLGTV